MEHLHYRGRIEGNVKVKRAERLGVGVEDTPGHSVLGVTGDQVLGRHRAKSC